MSGYAKNRRKRPGRGNVRGERPGGKSYIPSIVHLSYYCLANSSTISNNLRVYRLLHEILVHIGPPTYTSMVLHTEQESPVVARDDALQPVQFLLQY